MLTFVSEVDNLTKAVLRASRLQFESAFTISLRCFRLQDLIFHSKFSKDALSKE